jgi:hypothetical protein
MADLSYLKMDQTGVAVWSFTKQKFVPFIPCPGEKRVRIDEHEPLCNFAVYEAIYSGPQTFDLKSLTPLADWEISYS